MRFLWAVTVLISWMKLNCAAEITQTDAFLSQTHTCDQRGNMRYQTNTKSFKQIKHNNTLWYTWFSRYTSSSCTHHFISICFTHEHRPNSFKTTGRKWAVWSHSLCRNNNVNSWITANICLHYCYTEPSPFGAAMLVETSWEWGSACTCNVFADVTHSHLWLWIIAVSSKNFH